MIQPTVTSIAMPMAAITPTGKMLSLNFCCLYPCIALHGEKLRIVKSSPSEAMLLIMIMARIAISVRKEENHACMYDVHMSACKD